MHFEKFVHENVPREGDHRDQNCDLRPFRGDQNTHRTKEFSKNSYPISALQKTSDLDLTNFSTKAPNRDSNSY
jgi:hypothetical protein